MAVTASLTPLRRTAMIAVAQMTSTNDMLANFGIISRIAHNAAEVGARMLFLPECANFMSGAPGEGLAVAEELSGAAMTRYKSLAKETGLWISLAGFQERSSTPSKVFNTHVVVDAHGSIRAVYRKMHLFDVDHPDVRLKESEYVAPGDDMVCVDTPVGRLGLTTCYDLRFPALFAVRAARAGRWRCFRALRQECSTYTAHARTICCRRWYALERNLSPCRPRSLCPPAARTGRCCCARAPSKRSATL